MMCPTLRLNRLAQITLGKMLQPEARSDSDVQSDYLRAAHIQPDGRIVDLDDDQRMWFSAKELVELTLNKGDVVVVEGGAGYGRSAVLHEDRPGWAFQNSIIRCRPKPGRADGRFLDYALRSALEEGKIALVCSTATIPHFTAEKVSAFEVPAPQLPKQRAIADFLDRETAKIDALIEKQNDLIALLRERREACIWEAVTMGTGGAKLQTTRGSSWFPVLPTGWSLPQIGHGFEVLLGKMLDAAREPFDDDIETPYIRAANIQDEGLILDDVKTMPFRPLELVKLSLREGDLLVVEGGSVGTVYLLPEDMPGWSFQKTVNRVRSRAGESTRFLGYVIRGLRDRGLIDLICDGSTIAHLTAEKLRALRVPSPPRSEQTQIADHLDKETARIDALIAKAELFVQLARERRAALITAAVTGQIEVH